MTAEPYPPFVHGYIALIDPQTNQRYLPITGYNASNHPWSATVVDFSILFRAADGSSVRTDYANAQVGYGLEQKMDGSENPIALKYKIFLTPVSGNQPYLFKDTYQNLVVYFDPETRTYDGIEVTQIRFFDRNGNIVIGGTSYTGVDAQARATNWADLEDF